MRQNQNVAGWDQRSEQRFEIEFQRSKKDWSKVEVLKIAGRCYFNPSESSVARVRSFISSRWLSSNGAGWYMVQRGK